METNNVCCRQEHLGMSPVLHVSTSWVSDTCLMHVHVQVCNQWSNEESSMLEKYARQQVDGGLNFGLFSISAKSDTSQGTDNYGSSFIKDKNCIRVKGAQIIAWWGEINAGHNQGPMPPVSGK